MSLHSVSLMSAVAAASALKCTTTVAFEDLGTASGMPFCDAFLKDKAEVMLNDKARYKGVCIEGKAGTDNGNTGADHAKYLVWQDRVAKNSYWNTQGQPHDFPPQPLDEFSDAGRAKTGYFYDGRMCTGLWHPSRQTVQVGSSSNAQGILPNTACGWNNATQKFSCAAEDGQTELGDTQNCMVAHPWMAHKGQSSFADPPVQNYHNAPWCWNAMYQHICGAAFPLVLSDYGTDPNVVRDEIEPSCYLDCRNTMMWCNRLDPESQLGQRILDYQDMNSDSGFENMYVVPGYCEYWQGAGKAGKEGKQSNSYNPTTPEVYDDEFFANQFRPTPPPGTIGVGDEDEDGVCFGVSGSAAVAPALVASVFSMVALALALH